MNQLLTQVADMGDSALARWVSRFSGPKARDSSIRVGGLGAFILLALLLAIVVSHGCHRDDFDHEPCFIPKLDQEP